MARKTGRTPRRRQRVDPEQLTASVRAFAQSYYISRPGAGEGSPDDEAAIEIDATIESVSARHAKYVGQTVSMRLLQARRYTDEGPRGPAFFGSVTIRGPQRSVLAYLPPEPFWALPAMIERGARIIQCSFTPTARGFGDLLSFYVTKEGDPDLAW